MLTNPGPWLLALTGSLALGLGVACSASSPRDQNFGSDIGRRDASADVAPGPDVVTVDEMPAPTVDATMDTTLDVATETMDDDAANAQDIVDSDAVDGGNL